MDKENLVIQWIEDHWDELRDLLIRLVRIPSVSGQEYEVQMTVREYAEKIGLQALVETAKVYALTGMDFCKE